VNFQPIGTSGLTALSDCKRYMVTRSWNADRWDVWLQATEGQNTQLAKNLENREAAERFCDEHAASGPRETRDTKHQTQQVTP
jgi:hypothetical protein